MSDRYRWYIGGGRVMEVNGALALVNTKVNIKKTCLSSGRGSLIHKFSHLYMKKGGDDDRALE